jgi:hypothetical protein
MPASLSVIKTIARSPVKPIPEDLLSFAIV